MFQGAMKGVASAAEASACYCTFTSPEKGASSFSQQKQLKVEPADNASTLIARLPSSLATELPRENTFLEEIAAVLSLGTLFGLVWLGPWLGMAFVYMVFVQQSQRALLIGALLFAETYLPAGQASASNFPSHI
ncbi:hypothetical protein COCSUDRAFT_63374 [Coccomyxa subellipsoidea C-169]|uniref:Uncharacterized protein n=1 Tax=Coccomyxa subellipsoidea (strain C-169) TaxID=574566 RepID=I0YX65_COCSC|nr:hypothetical protein COCSUDRAFT_63374 [Coccomyxa subellipsoidea C-169]EIE22984.1 hypothetical protein COCSUDRAFT_63374 [Coccomyxa subellipsoidea C-169]|eukprot:XP_005647528.1 hypothetical protein COCSUDRAFT_63374 [Coccomyxa subellipsoidea C-169]